MCGAKKLKGEEKRDGIPALCAAAGPPARDCKTTRANLQRQLDAPPIDAHPERERLEARAPEE